jgi:hypothetical protein
MRFNYNLQEKENERAHIGSIIMVVVILFSMYCAYFGWCHTHKSFIYRNFLKSWNLAKKMISNLKQSNKQMRLPLNNVNTSGPSVVCSEPNSDRLAATSLILQINIWIYKFERCYMQRRNSSRMYHESGLNIYYVFNLISIKIKYCNLYHRKGITWLSPQKVTLTLD